jgi:hypothetical protein
MFKETIGKKVRPSIGIDADLGYMGIEKVHPNSRIPKKASEYYTLTKRDKAYNTRLVRERVIIEHINAKINVFK